MEPAAAIGVASGSIAFLRFTIDICKTFNQIITSHEGITKHNADVAETVKRYKEMSEALEAKGASATSLELGPNISRAVDESIAISAELLALIEQLRQAKGATVIGTLKAVYRSMRSQERVERLQRKAEHVQSAICQGLLQATRETSILNLESSSKAFQDLEKQDAKILAALKAGDNKLLKQVIKSRRHFESTVSDLQDSIQTGHDDITGKLDSLTHKVLEMANPDLKKAFLDSLFFSDFERREKDLSGPSPKTFEWIFDRDPSGWPSFPQWLENSDSSQQYWLSGKAGSGKSTLMAHIIRDDLALNRTKDHLKAWHGTKPLHILKFFLFRPGRERQAGLEFLLRSLLYQLVIAIPVMQEILMANFLLPDCGARIPTWPIKTLKSMLSSALDAADDCCFLIFIDGADEFEDFQHMRGQSVLVTDLVDFLFDIQQLENVKLCISSRPGLRIANFHSSFLEAKLADLNYDDIRRFVDEQMQAMTEIPDLGNRSILARDIAQRSDGIFLWAAFAVTQMRKACCDGYGEDYSELAKKLDEMGTDLSDAISQLLRGIERSHRPALAFYLQALKSWQRSPTSIWQPMTVGMIVLSRCGEDIQTRSEFLAACRREERDIQNFSQGVLEVKYSRLADTTTERCSALVRSHSDRSSESDLQDETLDFESGEGAWVTTAHIDHCLEILDASNAGVSLIHRSVYDFFFAPDDWNSEHVEQCRSLFDHNEESRIPAKVGAGLRKLLWIKPCIFVGLENRGDALRSLLMWSSGELITYMMSTADPSLAKCDHTRYVDDLLSSMRLELLLSMDKASIVESRKHVRGDIFSRQTHDGYLRVLDEDRLLIFEPTGLQQNLRIMAEFEGAFLLYCSRWKALYDYVENRLVVAPLVQASLLQTVADAPYEDHCWWLNKGQELMLDSVQRWVHVLARNRRTLEFHKSVWWWIVRLVSRYDSSRHESLRGTRLSKSNLADNEPFSQFQWTPLGPDDVTGWHEEIMVRALISYSRSFYNLPGDSPASRILDRLTRITEPWDVWVQLLSASEYRNNRTALFVRRDSLSTCGEYTSDFRAGRYRLMCFDKPAYDSDS